ncbi:uncharacterized protein LOC133722489 [Rosa rugosa]|uniref:uncharacterized protein LOC133722489 n=1 Tax=Rosa rugosa TaxID=74645 RepID=UPI002B412170|nr:uncharacterized protein LOC133722489 [Rosa rugosa]
MVRTVQASVPSSSPVSSAFVPPPPPPPITNIASASHQPTDEFEPLQRAEFHNSLALLQEEFHLSLDSINHNHTSFQNHITAQMAALQSTVVRALTGQPLPIHSSTTSPPISAPSIAIPPPPRTPANIPPITFGSISTPTMEWPTQFSSLIPPVSANQGSPPHTPPPFPSAPPHYSTITSFPQPTLPPNTTITPSLPDFHIPLSTTYTAPRTHTHNTYQYDPQFFRPPKIDLPRFTGDDAVGWISMAERYLRTQRIPPSEKVTIAASHFGPDACFWMNSFEQRHPFVTWEQFVPAFLAHFGAGATHDFKIALSHLQQTSTVELFITAFTKLSCRAPDWNDNQLLPMFLGGLKPALRHDVMAFNPLTVTEAQRLARCYEAKMSDHNSIPDLRPSRVFRPNNWSQSSRYSSAPYPTNNFLPSRAHNTLSSPTPTNTFTPPTTHLNKPTPNRTHRILSTSEQRERRAKGLCFNCDEQYTPTHSCKQPFLAILEAPNTTDDSSDTPEFQDCTPTLDDPIPETEVTYPLHAITHTAIGEMMRLAGSIQGTAINVFIDCGSASNFLHPAIAHQLQLKISSAVGIHFYSASGERLQPSGIVHNVKVSMQNYSFTGSFLLLPVPGCDLVLGAQWLNTLGLIAWHFQEKIMGFFTDGHFHVLKGITKHHQSTQTHDIFALIPSTKWDSTAQTLKPTVPPQSEPIPPPIQSLLDSFSDLFSQPMTLPPVRTIDHCINLLPNTTPINVRPYRYPHSQKAELEKQVTEMLSSGLIRPSSSPFSSPVLLVKKKEGTWRFCVDYRSLNAATVKDRFPIPVVDELLDELHGANFFTKLDLRSGYHQVRMAEKDISKTAFRTHEGHFEFVVMPFGLTNAPSTFQALMNQVFKPLLRKSVLVFFDDILVYSNDLQSHVMHLEEVFALLRTHHLRLKLTKCRFATAQVDYLGHVISSEGVAVDPTKVQAIQAWPKPTTLKGMRGFLGITGYYRRFIQNYGITAKPLTEMLRADNFKWTMASETAFEELKRALMTAPVLALPDFSIPFIVETDACGLGIGAVLSQRKHPIAFISKSLSPRNQLLSVYDKEMLAVMHAIDKWRPYLLGHQFNIITDHQTLKHLLDQRISTPSQHKWLAKLMGYQYTIEYRPGKLNTVPDLLSRRHEMCAIQAISAPVFDGLTHIAQVCLRDPEAQAIITQLQQNNSSKKGFTLHNNHLLYKGKFFVPSSSDWRTRLLYEFHSSL